MRYSSISQAMTVFRSTVKRDLKTILTDRASPLEIDRSSVEKYLKSVAELPPGNPWSCLNRVAHLNMREGERILGMVDSFLAFPRAVSTRMDFNGKHIVLSGRTERTLEEAVVYALRGAHVTLSTEEPHVFTDRHAPIQEMTGMDSFITMPPNLRPMECLYLSSLRLIRPMVFEKTEFELPEEILELLTFLDPKEAKVFQMEEANEFIDVINGIGSEKLSGRALELHLGQTLSNSMVKHAALAWLNPRGTRMDNLMLVPDNCDQNVGRFVKFAEKNLGFIHRQKTDQKDRLVVGHSSACDSDPFMLASQHLTQCAGTQQTSRKYPSKTIQCPKPDQELD